MKKHTSFPAVLLEAQLRNISDDMRVFGDRRVFGDAEVWGREVVRMMKIVHDKEKIAAACFTCQKMLSMVLPRKPSLLSEDRSLGPSIVMNSSKSTWPSPVGHTGSSKERQTFRRTHKVAARPQAKSHVYQFISLAKTKQIASRQTNRRMRPGPWQTPTHLSNRCWLWAEVATEGTFFANWNSDATRFVCVLCILLQHAPTDRNQQAPCGVTAGKHFCLSSCVIDLNSALWSYIFPLLMLPNFPFIDKKTALIGLCCSLCSHIGKLVTSPPRIFL